MGLILSKYSSLSDEELLNAMTDKRSSSPIIEELCHRIEGHIQDFSRIPDANHRVECPICQAQLEADFDDGNNMFTLEEHE